MSIYRSLQVDSGTVKNTSFRQATSRLSELPPGELIIAVQFSALSYCDALILSGKSGRKHSPVPGTDAAGVVVKSEVSHFKPGDEVVVTGFGLGEKVPGGFGRYISVPADWAVHIPIGMSTKQAMVLGSAGISAGICAAEFTRLRVNGPVAVSLASFDFGITASALLAKLGYIVKAYVSDAVLAKDYLGKLGIKTVLSLDELRDEPKKRGGKISEKPSVYGVYDIAGGDILSALINECNESSTVVLAGNIESDSLSAPVSAIINKNLTVTGINAFSCPLKIKEQIWHKYTGEWKLPLEWFCTEISMDEVAEYLPKIVDKSVLGRVVINMEI